jgi:hypothetical protein
LISAEELLDLITKEDIINILSEFDDNPKTDNNNNLYFKTICHGGKKKKLHYFNDSKLFCCYTECGTMSLYDLLMNINNWTFAEAFKFVANYKGIRLFSKKIGLQKKKVRNTDLDFLEVHTYKPNTKEIKLPEYNDKVLNMFSDYMPLEWEQEGITEDSIKRFGIKFCFSRYAAIIPHRSFDGKLIGIRGRHFLQQDIEDGRKYMPIMIQGLLYRYPTNYSLYGIWENKENIKKYRKVMIFEGEKSVLKIDNYLGENNNVALATLGMNLSLYQRNLLLGLGVEEIIICYDKQYNVDALEDKNHPDHKEIVRYIKNIIKIIKMFVNYCNVYVIFDWDNKLNYKDSPVDKGKEVFLELLQNNKYLITDVQELEELIQNKVQS